MGGLSEYNRYSIKTDGNDVPYSKVYHSRRVGGYIINEEVLSMYIFRDHVAAYMSLD